MKYLALILPFLVLLPASALAAELEVRSQEGRAVMVRYEDMKGATLSVLSPSGEKVRQDMRLPKNTGTKRVMLPKDMEAGSYTLIATDGAGKALDTATFSLTYPAPTCTMTASEKALTKGDLLRIRWSSENAHTAMLFGNKKVELDGRERISLYHAGTRAFALNLFGKGGVGSCSVRVNVSE